MSVYGGRDIMRNMFIFVVGDGNRRASVTEDGWLQYTEHPEGAEVNPTLRLDWETARELGALLARNGLTPEPPDAKTPVKEHLADAITVRDRLLAIVERK